MTDEIQFVGGPLHGQFLSVPHGDRYRHPLCAPQLMVPYDSFREFEEVEYRREDHYYPPYFILTTLPMSEVFKLIGELQRRLGPRPRADLVPPRAYHEGRQAICGRVDALRRTADGLALHPAKGTAAERARAFVQAAEIHAEVVCQICGEARTKFVLRNGICFRCSR